MVKLCCKCKKSIPELDMCVGHGQAAIISRLLDGPILRLTTEIIKHKNPTIEVQIDMTAKELEAKSGKGIGRIDIIIPTKTGQKVAFEVVYFPIKLDNLLQILKGKKDARSDITYWAVIVPIELKDLYGDGLRSEGFYPIDWRIITPPNEDSIEFNILKCWWP